ncbi:DUF305 domain-containing protein [Limnobacter sp.]|uniref:DUF305 domain-containing protein n=1 Tax=Limnobacter sp. TaxID=2003368 RepID=UPI00311F957B
MILSHALPVFKNTVTVQSSTASTQPNSIDIGFAQSMIIHHDQAISMASLVKGKVSPSLDLLASGILTAQLLEVGQMKGWLNAWNQRITPPPEGAMSWVENAKNVTDVQDLLYIAQCKSAKGAMPGMLNVDEFNEMRAMTDKNLERRFLEAMIAHHQAAIPMARFAVNNGESLLVKGLAKAIIREQAAEISLMNKLLAQINSE